MLLKSVSILLILTLFFSACSSVITEIPVKEYEYIEITDAEVLFVTTSDGITHEVTNFQFTNDKLVGKEKSGMLKKRTFETDLSEISFLKIMGARDSHGNIIMKQEIGKNIKYYGRTTVYTFGWFLGSLPGGFLAGIGATWISLLIVPDNSAHGYGVIGRVLFIGIPAGVLVIVAGTMRGFRKGKNKDQRKAVEKIEERRYGKDREELEKSDDSVKD